MKKVFCGIFSRILQLRKLNLKKLLLSNIAFILIAYSLFSSPGKSTIGIPEFLIALSSAIIFIIGFKCSLTIKKNFFFISAIFSCFSLILLGLIYGLYKNLPLEVMVRDIIPMLYFTLPIFIYGAISKYSEDIKSFLLFGLFLNGLVNCLKYLYGYYILGSEAIVSAKYVALILEPSLIFTALFCTYSFYLTQINKNKNFFIAILYSLGYFIFYHAILLNNSRAAHLIIFFLSLLFSLFFFKLTLRNFLYKSDSYLATLLLSIQLFIGYNILTLAKKKTEAVGFFNGRVEEYHQIVESNHANIFLGSGWGAKAFLFTTGAYSGFSHNLPIFIFWKTGFLGLIFLLFYFFWLFSLIKPFFTKLHFLKLRIDEIMLIFALLISLFFNSLFVAGYKHLTYSFLLILYVAYSKILFKKYIK